MSASSNSDLPVRLVSAMILGSLVLLITWYGDIYFRVLMGLGAFLIFKEWTAITLSNQSVGIIASGWVLLLLGALAVVMDDPIQAQIVCVAAFVLLAVWGVVSGGRVWAAGGVVYALAPAIALAQIRDAPSGLMLIILIFVIVWATDIGAYIAGRTFGGPKLMPSVSPKKTWSGFFGGFIAAIAGTLVFLHFGSEITISMPIMLAGALSILSQLGDLFESWIKRLFNVKDSGRLIPGHGGIMDRVDGLVVAAVAFYGLMIAGLI